MKQTIYRKRILMLVLLLGIAVSAISVHAADSIRGPQISDEGIIFWDCIYFGSYYQNDSSTKEPILWRVLSVNGNDAFLLADQNLDCYPYCHWEARCPDDKAPCEYDDDDYVEEPDYPDEW